MQNAVSGHFLNCKKVNMILLMMTLCVLSFVAVYLSLKD